MRRISQHPNRDFDRFVAAELFCPTCRTARAVQKRLLLALLDRDRYDYVCTVCGNVVGQHDDKGSPQPGIIVR